MPSPEVRAAAERYPCPTCGAKAGQPCTWAWRPPPGRTLHTSRLERVTRGPQQRAW